MVRSLWRKYACVASQVVCAGEDASCEIIGSSNMTWDACRPLRALSIASDRQSTISLGTSYGPGLSRMSFKPRGPGAGETGCC